MTITLVFRAKSRRQDSLELPLTRFWDLPIVRTQILGSNPIAARKRLASFAPLGPSASGFFAAHAQQASGNLTVPGESIQLPILGSTALCGMGCVEAPN